MGVRQAPRVRCAAGGDARALQRRASARAPHRNAPRAPSPLPPPPARSFGTYFYLDGGRYEGDWVDDRIHGKGKSVYSNGNVYDGEWTDGRINGYGTLTYADGDKYIGQWVEGKMNGQVRRSAARAAAGRGGPRGAACVVARAVRGATNPPPPLPRARTFTPTATSTRASGRRTSATARAR